MRLLLRLHSRFPLWDYQGRKGSLNVKLPFFIVVNTSCSPLVEGVNQMPSTLFSPKTVDDVDDDWGEDLIGECVRV